MALSYRWYYHTFNYKIAKTPTRRRKTPCDNIDNSIQLAVWSLFNPSILANLRLGVSVGRSCQSKRQERPTSHLPKISHSEHQTPSTSSQHHRNNASTAEASLGRRAFVWDLEKNESHIKHSIEPTNQPYTSLTQIIWKLFESSELPNNLA